MSKDKKDLSLQASELPFSDQIPVLVTQVVRGRADRSRRAEKRLLSGLSSQETYNATLETVAELQKHLLEARGYPEQIRVASLLDAVFDAGTIHFYQSGSIKIDGNPLMAKTLRRLKDQDLKIRHRGLVEDSEAPFINNTNLTDPRIKRARQGSKPITAGSVYNHTLKSFVPLIEDGLTKGSSLELFITDENTASQESKLWADWVNTTQDTITGYKRVKEKKFTEYDDIVDAMYGEPRRVTGDKTRFVDARYSGITIGDIEKMEYPLSDENVKTVTDYYRDFLATNPSNIDTSLLQYLFLEPKVFFEHERIAHRHENLFAILNQWNERFLVDLVTSTDPERLSDIHRVLRNLDSQSAISLFTMSLPHTVSYPQFQDPSYDATNLNFIARSSFLMMALVSESGSDDLKNLEKILRFTHIEDLSKDYFMQVILPFLKSRLGLMGLESQFSHAIDALEELFTDEHVQNLRLHELKAYFDQNVGGAFLEKLGEFKPLIDEVSDEVWSDVVGGDIHFRPMSQGMNSIIFSEESLPAIMGLKDISFSIFGQGEEERSVVRFHLKNSKLGLIATLDKDGQLILKTPIDRDIPGLYTLLRHLAVVVFHDLSIQQKANYRRSDIKSIEADTKEDDASADVNKKISSSPKRSLPRIQKDTSLISEVLKLQGIHKPRRVELHKAWLRGAQEYISTSDSYKKASESGDEENINLLRGKLERARRESYHASEEKVANLPLNFKLTSVTDPITQEVRYLQTWVVEHTSPKPTPEELASPQLLFRRYYKGAAALGFLDQLKPWLISALPEYPVQKTHK